MLYLSPYLPFYLFIYLSVYSWLTWCKDIPVRWRTLQLSWIVLTHPSRAPLYALPPQDSGGQCRSSSSVSRRGRGCTEREGGEGPGIRGYRWVVWWEVVQISLVLVEVLTWRVPQRKLRVVARFQCRWLIGLFPVIGVGLLGCLGCLGWLGRPGERETRPHRTPGHGISAGGDVDSQRVKQVYVRKPSV